MVSRSHVLALVRVALLGPSDPHTVSPDTVWHGPRWSGLPLADLDVLTLLQLGAVVARRRLDDLHRPGRDAVGCERGQCSLPLRRCR
jgi:hypothetical protein